MARASIHWLAWATTALLLVGQVAAYSGTVTYTGRKTADLLQEDDRFDLYLTTTATAAWTLSQSTLTPGATGGATLGASAGQLTITVDYDFHPACCPNAAATGSKTVNLPTPLGCQDASYADNGWTVTLTLCGTLTATIRAESGTVTPTAASWAAWANANQNLLLTPAANAASMTVNAPTAYAITATVKVNGFGLSRTSDPRTLDTTPGSPDVREGYPVAQPQSPPPPPPLPAPAPAAPPATPPPATPATTPSPTSPAVQSSPASPPAPPPTTPSATPGIGILAVVIVAGLAAAVRRKRP